MNLGKIRVPLVVYRPPSSSPDPTMRSIDRKPSSMGIAELEPRQLAPTVGTTGSGSTGSPAPSSPATISIRSHLRGFVVPELVFPPWPICAVHFGYAMIRARKRIDTKLHTARRQSSDEIDRCAVPYTTRAWISWPAC
jgi:hypothetical protein